MGSMVRFVRNFLSYIKFCNSGGYKKLTLNTLEYPHLLNGKKVIITGGSKGIGLAMAKKFLSVGASVLITGRNEKSLKEAASQINNEKLHYMVWDVCDISIIDDDIKQAVNLLGGCDILINNAASVAFRSFESVDEQFFSEQINTNLKAVYFLSQRMVNYFLKSNGENGGKIVNISSLNSFQNSTELYYITKAALNRFTAGLAARYADRNIQINGIAPGIVAAGINNRDVETNAYFDGNKIHRMIVPEDIAETALFLCSGAANAIVGQTIVVDGGTLL